MQFPGDDIDPDMFEGYPPSMNLLETIGFFTCFAILVFLWIQLGVYMDKRYERKMKMKLTNSLAREEELKEENKKRSLRRKKFLND